MLADYFQPAKEEFLSLHPDERRMMVEWYEQQLGQEIVPLYDGEFSEDQHHSSPPKCNFLKLSQNDSILYRHVVSDFMRKVFANTVSEEEKDRVEMAFLNDPQLLQKTIEENTK